MLENIKKLTETLNNKYREWSIEAVMSQLHLAETTVRQHYLSSFKIKESNQIYVLEILQAAHFLQSVESRKLSELKKTTKN